MVTQARNHGGGRRVNPPIYNFSPPQEKCVGNSLKVLDNVQKIWAPLRKLFPLLVSLAGYEPVVT